MNLSTQWRTLLLYLGLIGSSKAEAASVKSKSTEKSFWWTVPNGGHSSARIKLEYRETYKLRRDKAAFTQRRCTACFRRAGATSLPKYSLGKVTHSSKKKLSPWRKGSDMYDPNVWNSVLSYENNTSVQYARKTKATGTVKALVTCRGGNVPTRAVSVTQRLNTK